MIKFTIGHDMDLLLWEQTALEKQTFSKGIVLLYLCHGRERKEQRKKGKEKTHREEMFKVGITGSELRNAETNECRNPGISS